MKAVLIGILFALAAALAGPAAAQPLLQQGVPFPPAGAPQPSYTVSDAVITALEVPPVGSGVIHVYVDAKVTAPGADSLRDALDLFRRRPVHPADRLGLHLHLSL
ncbi:MAG TPA: hypothetical protein VGO55_01140 [Allosphingosinicella sp.]|nr:hypothetical protein [Allosphingosinicella sp.]